MDTNKIKEQPPAPLCDVFASPLAQLISLETFVSPALLPVQRNFRANTCTRVPCETFAIVTHNTRKWCVNIVYTCMCVKHGMATYACHRGSAVVMHNLLNTQKKNDAGMSK